MLFFRFQRCLKKTTLLSSKERETQLTHITNEGYNMYKYLNMVCVYVLFFKHFLNI